MTRELTFRVREAIHVHQAFWSTNLPIHELAPHLGPVGHADAVVKRATRTQVEGASADFATRRAEPLLEVSGVGPGFEHQRSRSVEEARQNQGRRRRLGYGLFH